jgi:hypothetical protein
MNRKRGVWWGGTTHGQEPEHRALEEQTQTGNTEPSLG